MDCKKAQILFAPHIMGDSEPGREKYHRLEDHLLSCQACREVYDIRKQTIAFIEQHKAVFTEVLRTLEEKKAVRQEEIVRSWKCIEARLDEFEARERKEKRAQLYRLLVRVSAVAACLVIGIFIFFVFSSHSKIRITTQPVSHQATLAPKPSLKIELMSKNGNTLIASNQQIAVIDELETLVINGKQRLMMNTNTVLAVEPLVENRNIGCLVKLASGRIYAHVEHDGNPFIVDTAHGKAVITSAAFDVKVTDDCATLIVSEGMVQFESQEGVVNVTAGQTSKIVGQSAPSIPLSCNAAELTAWATGYKHGPAIARVESNTDPWELPLSFGKEPFVLEETDYDHWIEQKRDWFKWEFLWIFQLKEALSKEGIEVDYPDLLIRTGDVWRFVCLDVSPARFSVIDPNSLLKTVSNYGLDKLWLMENVPAAKSALETPLSSDNSFTLLTALERWLEYLDKTNGLKPPVTICLFHACKYLVETKSLIWFAVRDGKYDLTDEERADVLALLQEEVRAAYECQSEVLCPQDERKTSCYDDNCRESTDGVVGYIRQIKDIEEKFGQFMNFKR